MPFFSLFCYTSFYTENADGAVSKQDSSQIIEREEWIGVDN